MPQRTHPLSASPDLEMVEDLPVVVDDDRDDRFAAGVRSLKVGGRSVVLSERILLIVGGILAPVGLVVVLLGWWGASQTSYSFEQVPYLISGGLLGLGLVFLGSFFYFAHWLTQLVKEHREQSAKILAALDRLSDQLEARPAAPARRGRSA